MTVLHGDGGKVSYIMSVHNVWTPFSSGRIMYKASPPTSMQHGHSATNTSEFELSQCQERTIRKLRARRRRARRQPHACTKGIPMPVHLWVVLFHHESDELIRKLICDWDKEVDYNSFPTRLKFLITTRQCWIRTLHFRDDAEIFLLSRLLPSGRYINIDTHNNMLLKGGLGIAHIDMDHSNNNISNLRLVNLNEAIDLLMNFEDDNEEEAGLRSTSYSEDRAKDKRVTSSARPRLVFWDGMKIFFVPEIRHLKQ